MGDSSRTHVHYVTYDPILDIRAVAAAIGGYAWWR